MTWIGCESAVEGCGTSGHATAPIESDRTLRRRRFITPLAEGPISGYPLIPACAFLSRSPDGLARTVRSSSAASPPRTPRPRSQLQGGPTRRGRPAAPPRPPPPAGPAPAARKRSEKWWARLGDNDLRVAPSSEQLGAELLFKF